MSAQITTTCFRTSPDLEFLARVMAAPVLCYHEGCSCSDQVDMNGYRVTSTAFLLGMKNNLRVLGVALASGSQQSAEILVWRS